MTIAMIVERQRLIKIADTTNDKNLRELTLKKLEALENGKEILK